MINDKIPPQAPEVEAAVLGSLMLETDAISKVIGIIDTETFYLAANQAIFEAVKAIYRRGIPIDLISVTNELKTAKKLDYVGGPLYITQLTSKVASAAHIVHHARILAQMHMKRSIIKAGTELIEMAFDSQEDVADILDAFKEKVNNVENISLINNSGATMQDVAERAIVEMEQDCQLVREGIVPGITTGLTILNQSTGGWRKTNLVILAARPGIGKTSLALHFAKVAARAGKWVNFYTLEMKKEDLFRIVLSGESGINRTNIRDGRISDEDWTIINQAVYNLEKLPVIWYDYGGITVQQIKSNTTKNRKNGKCDLVVIDYMQLIRPIDKRVTSREQQISEISRTLKEISLNENVPVICLSQLNREAANEKPQLHHLRESGSIEQDADVVIMPWRDTSDGSEPGKYMITVNKNRRGKIGTFEIWANDEMTVFDNMHPNLLTDYKPGRYTEVEKLLEVTPF